MTPAEIAALLTVIEFAIKMEPQVVAEIRDLMGKHDKAAPTVKDPPIGPGVEADMAVELAVLKK